MLTSLKAMNSRRQNPGYRFRTSRRELEVWPRPLVMGVLNVTPDSFSDGGAFASVENAIRRAGEMVEEGADIIDIGGESTRPGSTPVDADVEISRTAPVIAEIAKRFDVAVSIDTTKSSVAKTALEAGAEIVNDISGLRFDPDMAVIAAEGGAGLVLMHSRGDFETMHGQPPVDDIVSEVIGGLKASTSQALAAGVAADRICLDVGIGFGKTAAQNLELVARLSDVMAAMPEFPMLVGASRKSFIGKILGDVPVDRRLFGSLAVHSVAMWNGAAVIRAHDVAPTRQAAEVVAAMWSSIS